ncbi:MAG: DUF177 domain-containing protein [Chitinispirillales bacterium]|jgi:uncharacterized protein|nr:DUF177 domain-containing protein [Chitinispirillales bacterium]
MVIDIRLVPEGHSRLERESRLEGFEGDLPPFAAPVRCRAEIDRMGGAVAVNLRFAGEFEMECARCLENYGESVESTIRIIIEEEQGRHGPAVDEDGEGVDFFFDAAHELVDISPAIYDEIMVSLPLKPLCSEDCGGILVDGVGGNDEKPIDPRWAGLMKIRGDGGGGRDF